MIKNERQLRITKTQLDNFQKHLKLIAKEKKDGRDSELLYVEETAIKEQIKELKNQIADYESIWGSKKIIPVLDSIDKIPRALIEARLSFGLSQRELAERMGLKEQQIQRYESTEFESASLARIKQLIKALDLKVTDNFKLFDEKITYGDLFNKIKEFGLDLDVIYTRILPPEISTHIKKVKKSDILDTEGGEFINYFSHIFPLTPEKLLGNNPLKMEIADLGNVRFKLRKKHNPKSTTAYTFYAHYIALSVLQATKQLHVKPLPTDPYEIHREIIESYGSLSLENAIRYVWNLGTPVLSLDDPGAFQGAYFKEQNRGIILLKSRTKSSARWTFDLFHEYWHATQHQSDTTQYILDVEDFEKDNSAKEEIEASLFAGAVLLGRSPDKLVQMCLKEANMDLSYLKSAVQQIAKRENVPLDVLANCVAYRLSEEGHDWWGTAEKLQNQDTNIPLIVKEVLMEFINLDLLTEFDFNLLKRALDTSEEKKAIAL